MRLDSRQRGTYISILIECSPINRQNEAFEIRMKAYRTCIIRGHSRHHEGLGVLVFLYFSSTQNYADLSHIKSIQNIIKFVVKYFILILVLGIEQNFVEKGVSWLVLKVWG